MARFLNSRFIVKMFGGQDTFAIGNDGTKRFNFVFALEIEIAKDRVGCLSCDHLTMGAITLFK